MKTINPYTVRPLNIKPGDVMMFVVKAIVVRPGAYRIYRCHYHFDGGEDDIPQGSPIATYSKEVCEAIFPSLAAVAEPDEF